jgi:hypothetical protein
VAYIILDDKVAHHRKFRAIEGEQRFAAFGVWVAAIGFCQNYRTDGVLRADDLCMLSPPVVAPSDLVAELVRVGLFEVTEDGWRVHDFLKHNMSAERRAELSRENADRQRKWRRRNKRKGSPIKPDALRVTDRNTVTVSPVTPRNAPADRDQDLNLERENPPLPPLSPGAPEATRSNPLSLSLVLNPNSPEEAPMGHADAESRARQWKDTKAQQRTQDLAEFAKAIGHPQAEDLTARAAARREGPPRVPPAATPVRDTLAELLARVGAQIKAHEATEPGRDGDEPTR